MTQLHYDMAALIPGGVPAGEARKVLTGAREYFAAHPMVLPGTHEIDQAMRRVASEHHISAIGLFQMLRVIFAWPLGYPGLFDTMAALGSVEVLARLDRAIRRFSDVA